MSKIRLKRITVYSLIATLLMLIVYLIPGNLTISAYATSSVTTYAQPTGVTSSDDFSCRIYDGSTWHSSFTYKTESDIAGRDDFHWSRLVEEYEDRSDCSNSFTSFEFSGGPVTVEITATNETSISSYRISPASLGIEPTISGNTLTFVLVEPTQLVVEVNGSTTDVMSVFANAPLDDEPSPTGTGVLAIDPGDPVPETGPWTTLYFMPGVHDIGKGFKVYSNKNYYIAGGAVVKGTFTNVDDYSELPTTWTGNYHAVSNIKIWGYGIISGEDYIWGGDSAAYWINRPIGIVYDFDDITVEGITFMDPALHTIHFGYDSSYDGEVLVSNVKVISWQRNGDGINITGIGTIEDCFLRVSDDGIYIKNTEVHDCIFWLHDTGNPFVFSGLDDALIEDCQIIYYGQITGTDMAVFRDKFTAYYDNKIFKNVRIENNNPVRRIFQITSSSATNVTFENIYVENTPTTNWNPIYGSTASERLDNWSFINNQFGGTNSIPLLQLNNVNNFTFTNSGEYCFSSDTTSSQGTRGWYYQYDSSGYKSLMWKNDRWVKPDMYTAYPCIIACETLDGMIPGNSDDAVLKWVAAEDGTINIEGTVKKYESGGNGVQVKIMKNSTQIWPASGWQDIAYNDLTGVSHDFDVSVETGDAIYFIVNSKSSNSYDWTCWDPTITY